MQTPPMSHIFLLRNSISRLIVALLLWDVLRLVRNTEKAFVAEFDKIVRNIQTEFVSYIKNVFLNTVDIQ